MTAVVDPGVRVSATLSPGGPPAQRVETVRAGHVVLVISPRLRTELETVLRRPRIVTRLDPAALDRVRRVVAQAPVVEDPTSWPWRMPLASTVWSRGIGI